MTGRLPPIPKPPEPEERPTVFAAIRSGAVYGATVGMLVGFLYLAMWAVEETEGIVVWRNFLLAGAFLGAIVGLACRQWCGPNPEAQDDRPT